MHYVPEETNEYQTGVDESIIMAHSEKIVKSMDKEHMTWKKNLVGVSCLGSEAIGCGFIRQINDSLYDDVDSQHLDVDFVPGSSKSIAYPDFEAIS